MPRPLFACLTIVAAFQLHLAAAAPVVEDAPVTPAVAALAAQLNLDPARDPSRFIAEMARAIYAPPDAREPALLPGRSGRAATAQDESPMRVPVPLPLAIWSRAIFRHTIPSDQLVASILMDRRAALLCRGLSALDDDTLTYFSEHPAQLTALYEHGAATFAAFAGALHVRAGRVDTPGGVEAVPLWEAAVQAPVADPDRFIPALFVDFDGRLGYLLETIGAADPVAARFALGLWIGDEAVRVVRFRALAEACIRGYREWHAQEHPFTRPLGDLAMLLLRVRVQPSGSLQAPAGRVFWATAFNVDAEASDSGPVDVVDAAWIVSAIAGQDMYSRSERLDAFAFGQRIFADVPSASSAEAADVVQVFGGHRMLLWTFERMGIRAASTYAAAIQRADSITDGDAGRRFWVLGQFEGALAVLARLVRSHAIGTVEGETLVRSLCAIPLQDGEYLGGLAAWVRTALGPVLYGDGSWEERTVRSLAGPSHVAGGPTLNWEGQAYHLDLPYAERQRMTTIRRKQGGHTIDLALAIDAIARTLSNPSVTVDGVRIAAEKLRAMADDSAPQLRQPEVNLLPAGVPLTRDALEWVTGTVTDLARITKPTDLRRAARSGASLEQLADMVLGNALVSIAYAADLGDPEGAALLAGNVALRHDFGFGRRDTPSRTRAPWALPRQDFQPGVPWHVSGSLLGLDLALAPLALHRLTLDGLGDAPKLSSIEREAFAVSVSLLDPFRLKDADRELIRGAIARGRARVLTLTSGEPLDAVVQTLGLDGLRLRALRWTLDHNPAAVPDQFSLVDQLVLGGGAQTADLDAWGPAALYSDGCACTRFADPRAWRILEGRAQQPMMAATMGDLNLSTAVMLAEMQLPSALARSVLSVGTQQFLDEVTLANGNDWWGLSREAQALRRQHVEDDVSVAAAVDGPLVPEDDGAAQAVGATR